jgi:hypothetical protein
MARDADPRELERLPDGCIVQSIEMMESMNRQVLRIAGRAGSRGGLPSHLLSDAWTASFLVLVLTIVVSTAQ